MKIFKFLTYKRNKALYSLKMFDIIIKSMFQRYFRTILFLHHGFKSKLHSLALNFSLERFQLHPRLKDFMNVHHHALQ